MRAAQQDLLSEDPQVQPEGVDLTLQVLDYLVMGLNQVTGLVIGHHH